LVGAGATYDCAREIANAKLATSSERFAALRASEQARPRVACDWFTSELCRTGPAGASGSGSSHHHRGAQAPPRLFPAAATMTSASVETHGTCGLANEPIGADKPRVQDTALRRRGRRLGGHR
jgi:hypothetical protein